MASITPCISLLFTDIRSPGFSKLFRNRSIACAELVLSRCSMPEQERYPCNAADASDFDIAPPLSDHFPPSVCHRTLHHIPHHNQQTKPFFCCKLIHCLHNSLVNLVSIRYLSRTIRMLWWSLQRSHIHLVIRRVYRSSVFANCHIFLRVHKEILRDRINTLHPILYEFFAEIPQHQISFHE